VVAGDGVLAGRQDLVVVSHHVVGGQAAVLLGEAHRTARRVEPDAQLAGGRDLGAEQIAAAAWMQVEVVGAGGAAREGELGQADPGRDVCRLLVQAAPQGVERLQPAEQGGAGHGTVGAGEVLVEVMVGVDEARGDQAAGGVDGLAGGRRLVGGGPDPGDQAVRDRDPAAGQLPAVGVHGGDEAGVADQQVGVHGSS